MYVLVCSDYDTELQSCASESWVAASELDQGADAPWLDVPGAVEVATAIGLVWASAWAFRAIAYQIKGHMR